MSRNDQVTSNMVYDTKAAFCYYSKKKEKRKRKFPENETNSLALKESFTIFYMFEMGFSLVIELWGLSLFSVRDQRQSASSFLVRK